MTLHELRTQIDRIDMSITGLLSERMELTSLVRRLKLDIEDSKRESDVIANVVRSRRGPLDPEFMATLYRSIIAESKRIQELRTKTIGFQGTHGANSELAAMAWMPDFAPVPCAEFEDVFSLISEGLVDYGILPVENSSGGIVGPVNALLINTDLRIVGAVDIGIAHCLLVPPGTDHRDIHTVYSHPQALLQCREFLLRNKLEPRQYPDTAGAAKMIAEERPAAAAAIANRRAAEIYGLDIVKDGIQDVEDNRTRFIVLAKDVDSVRTDGEKCSAVFLAEHTAGSLFRILEVFAQAGINLTRIESVPERPGDYAMFIDFLGSASDSVVSDAIEKARSLNPTLRILGCYNEKVIP